jgi:hypothetical protein
MENMTDNKFIIMWDENSLECIIPIDVNKINNYENDLLIAKLADDSEPSNEYLNKLDQTLMILKMRAQVNNQRNYEIYLLTTEPSIDQKTLEYYFENNPQMIVDIIRNKGTNMFGSGRGKK